MRARGGAVEPVIELEPCPISGRPRWHDGDQWRYGLSTEYRSRLDPLRLACALLALAVVFCSGAIAMWWVANLHLDPHTARSGTVEASWDVGTSSCAVSPLGFATAEGTAVNPTGGPVRYVVDVDFVDTDNPQEVLESAQAVFDMDTPGPVRWTVTGRTAIPATVDVSCGVRDAGRVPTGGHW